MFGKWLRQLWCWMLHNSDDLIQIDYNKWICRKCHTVWQD